MRTAPTMAQGEARVWFLADTRHCCGKGGGQNRHWASARSKSEGRTRDPGPHPRVLPAWWARGICRQRGSYPRLTPPFAVARLTLAPVPPARTRAHNRARVRTHMRTCTGASAPCTPAPARGRSRSAAPTPFCSTPPYPTPPRQPAHTRPAMPGRARSGGRRARIGVVSASARGGKGGWRVTC